jgi:hypothetical protein
MSVYHVLSKSLRLFYSVYCIFELAATATTAATTAAVLENEGIQTRLIGSTFLLQNNQGYMLSLGKK